MKIAQIKGILANSRIIDESKIDTSKVQLLNKVKLKNLKNNSIMTYTLVPESEANLKEMRVPSSEFNTFIRNELSVGHLRPWSTSRRDRHHHPQYASAAKALH